MRRVHVAIVFTAFALAGCSAKPPPSGDLLVLVHGAGGDWFDGLRSGLNESGIDRSTWTFHWGAPPPLFFLNLQDPAIHGRAESKLAEALQDWRARNPSAQLSILGHSAGCGVILGALAKTQSRLHIDRILLLAPSVSPTYDLAPALAHVENSIHVFHSDRDTFWLHWRTSTFGTYDNIKTPAAGGIGFNLSALPASLAERVIQHPYRSDWSRFGHAGGHSDALARAFSAQVLAPILRAGSGDGALAGPVNSNRVYAID